MLSAPAAQAHDLPPPDLATEPAAQVYVQLVVNGREGEGLVPAQVQGAHIRIAASDLAAAGLTLGATADDAALIDLSARTDIVTRYDPLLQRLSLTVPLDMLPGQTVAAPPRERVRATASTGAALNYNLYIQRSGDTAMASLFTEQRLFGSFGVLSNTGVLRVRLAGDAPRSGYLRYDTRFRHVDQDSAMAVTVGDVVTAALPWSGSVRLGGVQVGRSFAARPDLVTTPLPRFAGEAAVPSAVDVFIDGYRQSSSTVQPGRFVLDGVPVVNGAGQATLVTTDAVGRQVATTIPFYVSATLLRAGLTDFSAEAGLLRRGYGLRSFGYGPAAASFVVRHGLNRQLTVSGHGEGAKGLALGGIGADWSPGLWGTAHLALSASQSDAGSGTALTLGYDYSGRRFTFAAEHRRVSGTFRDLGTFDLAAFNRVPLRASSSSRVVLGVQAGHWGSLGFSFIDARAREGSRVRLLSASWSLPVSERIFAFASADYDVRRHAASGQVRLVVPLGRASVSGGLSARAGGALRADASVDLAVPTDGGWGGSGALAVDQRGSAYAQATGLYRSQTSQWEATAALAAGRSAVGGGVSGAVLAMDGGLFAANEAPSSFLVVDTGEAAGVPVTYENQIMGRTDAKGRLFVRDVTAWHPGRIAIDPISLDAGYVASRVETRVAVAEGAGAVVRMAVRRTRGGTARLVDAQGQPIAPGSTATLPDGRSLPVGWDGMLFLSDISGEALAVTVRQRGGGTCTARIAAPTTRPAMADLGEVPCR